ncbi:hypothetical protein HZD82_26295, partial [Pantoea agglomerans]|nr:hypothetical protein [Pantoea agglomerans]
MDRRVADGDTCNCPQRLGNRRLRAKQLCGHPDQAHEPGSTTVPARKFLDICRGLPDGAEITLALEGDRMLVR